MSQVESLQQRIHDLERETGEQSVKISRLQSEVRNLKSTNRDIQAEVDALRKSKDEHMISFYKSLDKVEDVTLGVQQKLDELRQLQGRTFDTVRNLATSDKWLEELEEHIEKTREANLATKKHEANPAGKAEVEKMVDHNTATIQPTRTKRGSRGGVKHRMRMEAMRDEPVKKRKV